MQINKIEFYNLNSLKGYWCIDFSDPDYKKNHNQFVICGETGSGKTTILDAITLALYGKTPRQEKSPEEHITKHTAKCMASVTYKCKKGVFRSTFKLWRANNKLDGTLKRGFNITNLESGEDTGNIGAVKDIENATYDRIQLKYEQFCRSIMLAQGKFDTFISSSPRDRADILAKMSGIDYKEIGNQIWLKGKKNIEEYKAVKEEIEGVALLSSEVESALTGELNILPGKNEELLKKIKDVTEEMDWLNQMQKLLSEKEQSESERRKYEAAKEKFVSEKKVLDKAEKALNCTGSYEKFQQLEKSDKEDRESLKSEKDNLEILKEKEKKLDQDFRAAKKKFEDFENLKKENEEIWKTVRGLDLKIENAKKTANEAEQRKNSAKKEFDAANVQYNNLNSEIEKIKISLDPISEYLEKHPEDKNLSSVLSSLKGKKESAAKNLRNISEENGKKTLANKEISQITLKKDSESENFRLADAELKNLVSTEYLSISLLLRGKLEDGKACPVCGGLEHPFCEMNKTEKSEKNSAEADGDAKNAAKVAEKIAELNDKIEKCKKNIQNYEEQLKTDAKTVAQADERILSEQKELEETEKDVNEILSQWDSSVHIAEGIYSFDIIISELEEKEKKYNIYIEEKAQKEKMLHDRQVIFSGINMKKLKDTFDSEEDDFEKKLTAVADLKKEREKVFGSKSVEEEESNFNSTLNALKTDSEEKNKNHQAVLFSINGIEFNISRLEENISKRKPDIDSAKSAFESDLSKNGFESESEFVSCKRSSEEISAIKKMDEKLKNDDSVTAANLASAKDKYEQHKKIARTDKTLVEIDEIIKNLTFERDKNLNRIGEINLALSSNEKNKKAVEGLQKKAEKLKKQADVWSAIQNMIGVKDGVDFQMFVEVYAFKNLLKKANKYMRIITKKYSLVQVPGAVDFKVHDDFYPDSKEDRPVTIMSGGERFIISLSLALGIAELASKNVKVDSLFLDEGFGTLSGKPLYESINALKSLQSSGKMLGIITHVSEVINSFDQKIEAFPSTRNAGSSELKGSGITYSKDLNAW